MKTIHFQVKDTHTNPKTSGFDGYYVIASFVRRTADGLLSSALKAELDNSGKGTFYFPPNQEIDQDLIHFEFYGPGGYWVAERMTVNESRFGPSNDAKNPYDLKIEIMKEKNLEKSFYTVNGRLVDISAKRKISKQSFHVIESAKDEIDENNYKIVQTLVTDMEGYFKLEIKSKEDHEAEGFYFAIIPASQEKIVPLRKNGKLVEDRQIIGITPVEEPVKDKTVEGDNLAADCSCEDTPRLPSSGDLASMEGLFSQDLGVGCVEFTKPNRVIEEYQFMHIVRTTDPQIQKVNLKSSTFKEILSQLESQTAPFVYEPIDILVFSNIEMLELMTTTT